MDESIYPQQLFVKVGYIIIIYLSKTVQIDRLTATDLAKMTGI